MKKKAASDSHEDRAANGGKLKRLFAARSFRIGMIAVGGVLVLALIAAWFWRNPATPAGDKGVAGGAGADAGPVTISEELAAPTNESPAGPSLDQTLAAVVAGVDSKATTLDDPALAGGSKGGPAGETGSGRASSHAWEIHFPEKQTLETYARQLDFFKIELGVLLPNNKIIYAHNLAKSKPDTRTAANPAAENRYYLTWRNGEMQQADRDLFSRAGVDVGDSIVVKFLSPEVEKRLIDLENAHAGADAKRIKKTRFGVRAAGAGFTFFVLEQSLNRY